MTCPQGLFSIPSGRGAGCRPHGMRGTRVKALHQKIRVDDEAMAKTGRADLA